MRWFLVVALAAVAHSCLANDWSLSTFHGGPRSQAMYQTPAPRVAPRWREARETRQLRHRRRHYDRVAAPEHVSHYRSEPERRRGVQCEDKVRGLGTQWIGEQGALDAAKKDWMERVRYDLGESYLDMANAQDFAKRCGRVSIGEALGQVMYRCEIVARPCKGEFGGEARK